MFGLVGLWSSLSSGAELTVEVGHIEQLEYLHGAEMPNKYEKAGVLLLEKSSLTTCASQRIMRISDRKR